MNFHLLTVVFALYLTGCSATFKLGAYSGDEAAIKEVQAVHDQAIRKLAAEVYNLKKAQDEESK